MERQDDRTEEQRATHTWAVAMTDAFMSGWGRAEGGVSVAAWACRHDDIDRVEAWVRSRREARRVRIVRPNQWRPRGNGHVHIYVVEAGHPALK